jgi:peptide/nickel transport system ATP-binding protein
VLPATQTLTSARPSETGAAVLLRVRNLSVFYGGAERPAVDGASFDIAPAERVALVGESGSGKTTLSLAVAGFMSRPGVRVVADQVSFDGAEMTFGGRSVLPRVQPGLAMTFQDAMTSLDPVWTVGSQLITVIRARTRLGRREARDRAREWLHGVGLKDTERLLAARPHELSGGMRQRVMMAIALAGNPRLLIADEPTSALDATLSRATMDLLAELTVSNRISLLVVSHDIHLCLEYCDRTLVMYQGHLVEQGAPGQLRGRAEHPYTRGLLACVPTLEDAGVDRLPTLRDAMTSASRAPWPGVDS